MRKRTRVEAALDHSPAAKRVKTKDLRDEILRNGVKSNVQVNQKALIDKMLARYAGNFSTFRELVQNADDAGASEVFIDFSSRKQHPSNISHLTEIKVSNNGRPFTSNDWDRISKIAEGNPDEQTVGMFGVGFYSVFSFTEKPMIYSQGEWLAFHWQEDQLCTSRMSKSNHQSTNEHETVFIFSIRDPKLSFGLTELRNFFESALYFSKNLHTIKMSLNESEICCVSKSMGKRMAISIPQSDYELSDDVISSLLPSQKETEFDNIRKRLQMNISTLEVFTVAITIKQKETTEWQEQQKQFVVVDALFEPNASPEFKQQCKRILKKNLPSTTRCSLLVKPSDSPLGEGRIYVGISTHQRTGCELHAAGHFYPTIERENIDFRDTYLSQWNALLLYTIGACARFYYDFGMSTQQVLLRYGGFTTPFALASIFSFGSSAPQQIISEIFASGFFSSPKPPQILTTEGIRPSSTSYMCDVSILRFLSSVDVPFPDKGYKMNSGFFRELSSRNLVKPLPLPVMRTLLKEKILSVAEMSSLLTWALKATNYSKSEIKKTLRCATYEDEIVKKFSRTKNFSTTSDLPMPSNVLSYRISRAFSSTVLQNELQLEEYQTTHWIQDFLGKKSTANELRAFLTHKSYAPSILEYFSRHFIPDKSFTKIVELLQSLPALLRPNYHSITMVKPAETSLEPYWIPEDENTIYIADLSTGKEIERDIVIDLESDGEDVEMDDVTNRGITKSFLKKLGVRVAPPAQILIFQLTSGHIPNPESALKNLYDHRDDLRDEDWEQLRQAKFLRCDNYEKNGQSVRGVYAPEDCYIPLSYLKLKNKVDKETEDLYSRVMIQTGYNTHIFVHFEKPPTFELITFMEQKLHIHAFPSLAILFTNRNQHDKAYEECMRFFMAFYKLFYDSFLQQNPSEKEYAIFLSENETLHPANELSITKNPICPLVHPFIVSLAQEYSISLQELGVREQPKVKDILEILKSTPELYITVENAPKILSSLSEISMSHEELKKLKQIPFVPAGNGLYLKCRNVLVPRHDDEDNEGQPMWTELFPYLDFGTKANEFLVSCGAKNSPSPSDLADAFIRGNTCQKYFASDTFDPTKYMELMKHVSININSLTKTMYKKLQNASSFLAIDSKTEKYRLVKAKDCYLIDNSVWKEIVRPLHAPETNDSLLTDLYLGMGSRWLSSAVEEQSKPVGDETTSPTTMALTKLIVSRYPLLTHGKTGYKLSNINNIDLERFKVKQIKSIKRVLKFENQRFNLLQSKDISMCVVENGILYIYEGCEINYFDIGLAISKVMTLNASQVEERGTMIAQLLQTPLRSLSARGWSIQRILGVDPVVVENNLTKKKDPAPMEIETLAHPAPKPQATMPDFGAFKQNRAAELQNIIKKSKSYSQDYLRSANQIEHHTVQQAPDDCMVYQDIHIDKRLKEKGILIYRTPDAKQIVEGKWLDAYHAFHSLLERIVACVPSLSMRSCKIFLDKDSTLIAFNYNCALFFNLRYFYQHQFNSSQYSESKALSSWFVTLCHELAHNQESFHNKEHERIMEELLIEYMPKLFPTQNVVVID